MASPSPRRRFQFRLQTLMISVALFAVACWVIMDRQRLITERDHALRQLEMISEANENLRDTEIELRNEYSSRDRKRQKLIEKLMNLEGKSAQSDTSP